MNRAENASRRVLVAMSGGVDSSVAASLLLRDGYEVLGCFMRLGSPGETLDTPLEAACPAPPPGAVTPRIHHRGCCSVGDAADARLVAAQLDIPFYVVNFKRDFGRIIDYFTDEYAAGRTPNPCVRCNDWLKFGRLHDYARQLGCGFVASGHYARIDPARGLLRGRDHDKDQSYVLFGMPRAQLTQTLLPVGGYRKAEVRALAEELGLPVFDKPDSQEICFVPDDDYAGLLERRRPEIRIEGRILDGSGREVGRHGGQHRFTIGQRRGLGVALGEPVYVVDKDARANTITVAAAERLLASACTAGEANWFIDPPAPGRWRACLAQHRAHGEPAAARVRALADAGTATPSGRAGRFELRFALPQRAVAPGQAIVLYDDDDPERLIGGGWIENVTPSTVGVPARVP